MAENLTLRVLVLTSLSPLFDRKLQFPPNVGQTYINAQTFV